VVADFKVDATEVKLLGNNLLSVYELLTAPLGKAVQDSGKRLQADARSRARAIGGHSRGYPNKITSTFTPGRSPSVEVGPILGGMGSLGGILEFGSPTSGPHPHLHPAFDEEVPKFDEAVVQVAGETLDKKL
jgi:hypothetical protein